MGSPRSDPAPPARVLPAAPPAVDKKLLWEEEVHTTGLEPSGVRLTLRRKSDAGGMRLRSQAQ